MNQPKQNTMSKITFEMIVQLSNIVVLPELEQFIPYRSNEEILSLKEQIKAEGLIRDPIVLWNHPEHGQVLIDGFSRRRACKLLNEETGGFGSLKAVLMDFTNITEVKLWMTINQMTRRNLSEDQRSYEIGRLYKTLKDKNSVESYLRIKGFDTAGIEKENTENTRAKMLAEHFNVSEKTVRRAAEYAVGLDKIRKYNKDLADQILLGLPYEGPKLTQKIVTAFGASTTRIESALTASQVLRFSRSRREVKEGTQGSKNALLEVFKKFQSSPTKEHYNALVQAAELHMRASGSEDKALKVA